MKIIIRSCTDQDFAQVHTLSEELGYMAADTATAKSRLTSILQSDTDYVWVADSEAGILGWLHLFRAVRLASAPFLEIGGMVVGERYRKKGIGRMLINRAEQQAGEMGLKLRARCNSARHQTHRFYERLDFTIAKSQYVFEKSLKKIHKQNQ